MTSTYTRAQEVARLRVEAFRLSDAGGDGAADFERFHPTLAKEVRQIRRIHQATDALRQALKTTALEGDEQESDDSALDRWATAMARRPRMRQIVLMSLQSELLFAAAQEEDGDALPVRIYEVFEERFGKTSDGSADNEREEIAR